MQKRRWEDLSATERICMGVAAGVQFALLGAALADIHRRSPAEINGSKRLWIAVLFFNYVGPLAYFTFGLKRGLWARMRERRG
ncbi:MAG: hypothetical protein GX601_19340 [Anaerolineales bacterium]|nr:hypothetical protein [Anaerolineales bacterium]